LSVGPTARVALGLIVHAPNVCDTSEALAGIRRATGVFDDVGGAAFMSAGVCRSGVHDLRDAFNRVVLRLDIDMQRALAGGRHLDAVSTCHDPRWARHRRLASVDCEHSQAVAGCYLASGIGVSVEG
jgi:hypothetical protein